MNEISTHVKLYQSDIDTLAISRFIPYVCPSRSAKLLSAAENGRVEDVISSLDAGTDIESKCKVSHIDDVNSYAKQ